MSASMVELPVAGGRLDAKLWWPQRSAAVVLLAHTGADASLVGCERSLADALGRAGFATMLLNLRWPGEPPVDVPGLAERLASATRWLRAQPRGGHLPLGYLGVGAAAAAAFVVSALHEHEVHAIVSRCPRPDAAGMSLMLAQSPSLFLVDGTDPLELAVNRAACGRSSRRSVEVVAAETVAPTCLRWFSRWLN